MNLKVKVIGLALIIICSGSLAASSSQDKGGTIVAVPLLSDDSIHCKDANSSGEFISGLVVSSQERHSDIVHSRLYLHNPGCQGDCASCFLKVIQPNIQHYMHAIDFNACHTDVRCVSWLKLCEEKVYGINFQIDNPTFSAILVSFTPSFQQCFAVYPLPTTLQPQASPVSHVYHIVHGRQQKGRLNGFTFQNPYDVNSTLSINLTGEAKAIDNGETLVPLGSAVTLQCREVLWVEPDLNSTSSASLSGTVLSSSTPLNVFTNSVVLNDSDTVRDFEYNSQLVHQMPERRNWGRHFIINPQCSEVLPEGLRSCLVYEVTIVSYTSRNRILLQSGSSRSTVLGAPTVVAPGGHYEYKLYYTQAQMISKTYLEITSTAPIVVLSEAYTSTKFASCLNHSLSFSILVQPVEWHANKQSIILVHPNQNITYHYLISIVVPSKNGDTTADGIIESEPGHYCRGSPVSSALPYPAGDNYTLLVYTKSVVNSSATQSTLLLRHADSNTRIGATVYAYSEHLHYSYSNGYTLGGGDSVDNETACSNVETTATATATAKTIPAYYAVAASLCVLTVITAVLVTAGIVMAKKCRWRWKRTSYDHLPTPHNEEAYPYDLFILCADEDESFVVECIEVPLRELGYTTLRKNTAPDGLFALGNTVVSDIDDVVRLCSRVIVVCSANYSSSDASKESRHCDIELNYCKELLFSSTGRVIPVILDGVGAADFTKFTQHRIKTADISSNLRTRRIFLKQLERDIGIRRYKRSSHDS